MPLNIYPPTLASTQPAFLYTTTSYPIYFKLQEVTSFREIGHAQIRVVKQSNNRTIVNTARYPDGTIYKNASTIQLNNGQYVISIQAADLAESWQPGFLYKVQMRFGTTPIWTNVRDFATWKQQQIDNQTFSEWSTVMILKPIDQPSIVLKNAEARKQDVIEQQNIEPTLTPLFMGQYQIAERSKEAEDKYKFDLYSGDTVEEENLLETSGWLQHNELQQSTDEYRFHYRLVNGTLYTVIYSIITANGYELSTDPYTFTVTQVYIPGLEEATLRCDDSSAFCKENGCIRLYFSSPTELNGTFVVSRTDEHSDFTVWEDMNYFTFHRTILEDRLVFTDFTIESGIKYRYAIQMENATGLRTNPCTEGARNRSVDFDYSYLFADGVQLRLSLNQQVSSFKHTVLGAKQDTLGGKYPHILKNGYAYYAEFPLNGLISIHMDIDQTFFTLSNQGYSYKGDLVIQAPKIPERQMERQTSGLPLAEPEYASIGNDLTGDNFFIERKFREKVEEFLNNYQYKLYRSPSEGNIIVILTNVSLTPNATLGRMVFNFSATAYEVVENTLENLDKYGIITVGGFVGTASDTITVRVSQIDGIYTTGDEIDIYSMIKEQEEQYFEGYKLQVQRVTAFWIDRYPVTNMGAELAALEAQRAQALLNGEPTDEFDAEIKKLQGIVNAIQTNINGLITLSVNGRRIRVTPNRIYALDKDVTELSVVEAEYPIVINYIVELVEVEDTTVGVISAIETSKIWGQLAGIFTDTRNVLKRYNNATSDPAERPYRIFNPNPDGTVVYDKLGRVVIDNTKFNAYKSENLYDVIQEEARKQVEEIYNIQGGFHLGDDGRWTNGVIYYEFQNLILFDIEADPGTILWIGSRADGSNKKMVKIGPTQRYTLNPMENLVRYIALDSQRPQFCIINYECLTSQMTMAGGGE